MKSITFNVHFLPFKLKRFVAYLFFTFLISSVAYATHNRAGSITYKHISGNTYQITIHTCTKTSAPADRPYLPISWGDGTPLDSIERSAIIPFGLGQDAQVNLYIKNHTFPGSGLYQICVSDPNRNSGILNINDGNSVQVPFAIQTTLRISAAIEPNNSVSFSNTFLQDACLWLPWIYNPGAYDIDGDSLAYKLVPSLGSGCIPFELGFYKYPNQVPAAPGVPPQDPSMNLSIDVHTGTVLWEVPQREGEYNLAILVEEWRDGFLVGTVIRDMQINVRACNNLPPQIEALADTCVEAGQTLTFPVYADDPNSSNVVLKGYGDPFQTPNSPADTLVQNGQLPPVQAIFNWNTNCTHVRLAPYQAVFQATDNGPGVSLVDIKTVNITVVAPAPENLIAEAVGGTIHLSWNPSPCEGATGYKIYRRINLYGFIPSHCETGVPAYTGYVEIAENEGIDNTTYVDTDEIIFGRENCYMVIAVFPDGAESYASNEACAQIKFEIPIIKKASVGITSAISGIDTLIWRNPIELDPEDFPGPYQYRLYRTAGFGEPEDLIFTSSTEALLTDLTTDYIVSGINTSDSAQTYCVSLYSGGELAAKSNKASSLFIRLIPDDNQITITWDEHVPWLNFRYDIYRQADGVGAFELVGSTTEQGYVDTALTNLREYCYYVVSYGSYMAVEENDTLINYSQQACGIPYDHTPPCPPQLTGTGDCITFDLSLNWTNPNEECPETDDVRQYNIYFTPVKGGDFELLQTIEGSDLTDWSTTFSNSIAGCYAVTALDSLSFRPDGSLVRNESELSNIICFDNCPVYSFPNVFTPNGDGKNDYFRPFPYRSIESVEFTVFNRWGGIVFQSTNPDILWDGTNTETGKPVSDGTYFYTCKVFAIRLFGLDPIHLSGYVSVFADGTNHRN